MSMKDTLLDSKARFTEQVAVPMAELVREKADELIDRVGAESASLGKRAMRQVRDLPKVALREAGLTSTKRARFKMVMLLVLGVGIGYAIANLLRDDTGRYRSEPNS